MPLRQEKSTKRETYASQLENKRRMERERYASRPEYYYIKKLEREKYASDPITKKLSNN